MPSSNFYRALAQSQAEGEALKQEKLKALYASQGAIAQKLAADADREARIKEADKERTFKGQEAQFNAGRDEKKFANALEIAKVGAGARTDVAETGAGARIKAAELGLEGRKYGADVGLEGRKYAADAGLEGRKYAADATITNQREGNVAAGERNTAQIAGREKVAQLNDNTRNAIAEKQIANQAAIAAARNDVQMKLGQLASADRQSAQRLRADLANSQNALKALEIERKVLADPLMDETKAQEILGKARGLGKVMPSALVPETSTQSFGKTSAVQSEAAPSQPAQSFGVMQSDSNTVEPDADADEPIIGALGLSSKAEVPQSDSEAVDPTTLKSDLPQDVMEQLIEQRKSPMEKNADKVRNIEINILLEKQQELEDAKVPKEQIAAQLKALRDSGEPKRKARSIFNEWGAQQALNKQRKDPSSGQIVTGPVVSDAANEDMYMDPISGTYKPKTWANAAYRNTFGLGAEAVKGKLKQLGKGADAMQQGFANMARLPAYLMNEAGVAPELARSINDKADEIDANVNYGDLVAKLDDSNSVGFSTEVDIENQQNPDRYINRTALGGAAGDALEVVLGKAGDKLAKGGLKALTGPGAKYLEKIPFVGDKLGRLLGATGSTVDDLAAKYLKPVTDKALEIGGRPLNDLTGKTARETLARETAARAQRAASVKDMAETVPDNPLQMPDGAITRPQDFASAIRAEIDQASAAQKAGMPSYGKMNPDMPGDEYIPLQHPQLAKTYGQMNPELVNTPVPTSMGEALDIPIPAGGKGNLQMTGPNAAQIQKDAALFPNPKNYPDVMSYDSTVMPSAKPPLDRAAMKQFESTVAEPQLPPTKVLDPNRTQALSESQILGTDRPNFANALEEKAFNSGLPYKDKMSEMAGYQNARLNFLPGTRIETPPANIRVAPALEAEAAKYGIPPDDLFAMINNLDMRFKPNVGWDTPEGAKQWIDLIFEQNGLK